MGSFAIESGIIARKDLLRIMQRGFVLLIVLFLGNSTLTAQTTAIRGTVVDVRQTRITGAEVVVISGDHIVTQAQTGIEGSFAVSLEPGLYTFEVAAAGFDKASQI